MNRPAECTYHSHISGFLSQRLLGRQFGNTFLSGIYTPVGQQVQWALVVSHTL